MTAPVQHNSLSNSKDTEVPGSASSAPVLQRKPMTAMRIRSLARDAVGELSAEQRRDAVNKVFEEIKYYAIHSEPEVDSRLLPDILVYWVKEKVMTPSADLFLQYLQCVPADQRLELVQGTVWQSWLLSSSEAQEQVIAVVDSMADVEEKAGMLCALIPAAVGKGSLRLLDAAAGMGFEVYSRFFSKWQSMAGDLPAKHRYALLERALDIFPKFLPPGDKCENYQIHLAKLLGAIKYMGGDSAGYLFAKCANANEDFYLKLNHEWPNYLISLICTCPSALPAFRESYAGQWSWVKERLDHEMSRAPSRKQ